MVHLRPRQMHNLRIFSYGSNMSLNRIKRRAPTTQVISPGFVKGHRLRFHKKSRDGSGKATIIETGEEMDRVWGVLVEIAFKDKLSLDIAEGLGRGYGEKAVKVFHKNQSSLSQTYVAQESYVDTALIPYCWYLDYMVAGAMENRLPTWYVRWLRQQDYLVDQDEERKALNRYILGQPASGSMEIN